MLLFTDQLQISHVISAATHHSRVDINVFEGFKVKVWTAAPNPPQVLTSAGQGRHYDLARAYRLAQRSVERRARYRPLP